MKSTIKRWIAFLLCVQIVVFMVIQVPSIVRAENGTTDSVISSEEVGTGDELTEDAYTGEESAEDAFVGDESAENSVVDDESAEDAFVGDESAEDSAVDDESVEDTFVGDDSTEDAAGDESADETPKTEIDISDIFSTSDGLTFIDENISLVDEDDLTGDGSDMPDEDETEEELVWMAYDAHVEAEAARVWADPEAYLGYTATLNVAEDYFYLATGFDANARTNMQYSITRNDIYNTEGNVVEFVLVDYVIGSDEFLWFKVEAAGDGELPEIFQTYPYISYVDATGKNPGMVLIPMMGTFADDTVVIKKEAVAASNMKTINASELPDIFEVSYIVNGIWEDYKWEGEVWRGYDLGDITGWHEILKDAPAYHYVEESAVILYPAEVSRAYSFLISAESTAIYEAILSYIPEEILLQFTSKHIANLEEHVNYLYVIENVEKTEYVTIGDKSVEVTVHGKIPMDGTLSVQAVTSDIVMAEGFDIKDASEIVTALDIKIYDKNGVEWQPEEGETIWVSIDMAALGYEDGRIFRLHHKHGEEITVYEIFVVMDGKITLGTNGFSLYVISEPEKYFDETNPNNSTNATQLDANVRAITLEVGKTAVYYFTPNSNEQSSSNSRSNWWVTDSEGAVYYELYSSNNPGQNGTNSKWIKITALKATTTPIKLRHLYVGGGRVNEIEYNLTITSPKATSQDPGGYRLYVKDMVNTQGVISATLVDTDGDEVTAEDLEGNISYSWVRKDGAYIIPAAYKDNDRSIDICVDHGGLLQTRLENVVYEVTATLPNGMKKTASYKVYYQSEILNAGFESPVVPNENYTFLPNGWPKLYWKSTSPGDGTEHLSKDVEFTHYGEGRNSFQNTSFYPRKPAEGDQFAELNAEKFGALYQDIITAPGESLDWEFLHSKRDNNQNGEAMFLIVGPTEHAQKATNYTELSALLTRLFNVYGGRANALAQIAANGSIRCTDSQTGGIYQVWYHDADNDGLPASAPWTYLSGSYVVPTGQYRSRLFFVTDPQSSGSGGKGESNYGNLIDSAKGGQYKEYLIEYYEEEYIVVDGTTDVKRTLMTTKQYGDDKGDPTDESGEAIMYSSVRLQNFQYFEEEEQDLLSMVYINGKNSPYNIKYLDYPCLFIESYPKDTTIQCLDKTVTKESGYYDQYDIVMQVCFRDTMIAVQKWVEFPKVLDGTVSKEALSATQKQNLIKELIEDNGHGYESTVSLQCITEATHFASNTITISKNDPAGWYTGYIPIGDNPKESHTFSLTEDYASPITGLELDKVQFDYFQFDKGERKDPITITYTDIDYVEKTINGNQVTRLEGVLYVEDSNTGTETEDDNTETTEPVKTPVAQSGIILDGSKDSLYKLAEVKVTNYYREKVIKINYITVGKGNISWVDENDNTVSAKVHGEEILYYSGTPEGVTVVPDEGYTFAGWYLDADCTVPVGNNHGYVDGFVFIPNKEMTITDENLEVTYYAKFSIGALQIQRKDAEPGQVFVYKIAYRNEGSTRTYDYMYVTLVIGDDGEGSVEIVDVPFTDDKGRQRYYTVTQLNEWSWRYGDGPVSIEKKHEMQDGYHGAINMITVFNFPVGTETVDDYWLNGNSVLLKNIHGGAN